METEKLIAALRCDESLGSQACKKCPYAADKKNMCLTIDLDAADALERLTADSAEKDAEIERLKKHTEDLRLDYCDLLADRDRLQTELDAAVKFIQHIDSEYGRYINDDGFARWRGKEHG